MPPEAQCPYCATIVPDWHFEWHTNQDQADIFRGKKSMECPFCRAGAAFDGFTVTKVESAREVAKRDGSKAARWAQAQNKSLRDYLQTREGAPYAASWTEMEVEAADRQAKVETRVMPLTKDEREFLDAYVYEATHEPFGGPATDDLRGRDIFYADLHGLLTVYHQELVGERTMPFGKHNSSPPPSPWANLEEARQRTRALMEACANDAQSPPAHEPAHFGH